MVDGGSNDCKQSESDFPQFMLRSDLKVIVLDDVKTLDESMLQALCEVGCRAIPRAAPCAPKSNRLITLCNPVPRRLKHKKMDQ